jgi:hypothetical protein
VNFELKKPDLLHCQFTITGREIFLNLKPVTCLIASLQLLVVRFLKLKPETCLHCQLQLLVVRIFEIKPVTCLIASLQLLVVRFLKLNL